MAIERRVNGERNRNKNEMIPIIDYWIKAARSELVKLVNGGKEAVRANIN